jgi:hypothetical protein
VDEALQTKFETLAPAWEGAPAQWIDDHGYTIATLQASRQCRHGCLMPSRSLL